MHRERPIISESADELKVLLKQEADPRKQRRLHVLFLFASDQAQTRQQAAKLLGLHRETIGRWMSTYAQGGLVALLEIYIPAGKPPTLPRPVLADLERHLHRPEGFASYAAMRLWLKQTYQIDISAKTLQKFVRRRFGARPKVARPSDIKKP